MDEFCAACGMELKLGYAEYHPIEFCILFKNGGDPWKLVDDILKYSNDKEIKTPFINPLIAKILNGNK